MAAAGQTRQFWLIYALAWLGYCVAFGLVFLIGGQAKAASALYAGVFNGLPQATAGIGVVWLCRRQPWSGSSPGRFATVHAAGAALYCAVVVSIVLTWFTLERGISTGVWNPGSYNIGILLWQVFLSLLSYCVITSICSFIQALDRLREQEARVARAEALQTRAELEALRARLNPHFLFNTLHSLLALVHRDAGAAAQALEHFGDLLRHVLRVQRETLDEVPLSEEWQFVRTYLSLEQLRIGERLRLETEIDEEALDCAVPSFCLQPLVENTIRHAIAPRASGGILGIRMQLDGQELELEVRDDGPGAHPERVEESSGLGLKLIRQRLEAVHGAAASFEIQTSPGGGWLATLRMPAQPWSERKGAG